MSVQTIISPAPEPAGVCSEQRVMKSFSKGALLFPFFFPFDCTPIPSFSLLVIGSSRLFRNCFMLFSLPRATPLPECIRYWLPPFRIIPFHRGEPYGLPHTEGAPRSSSVHGLGPRNRPACPSSLFSKSAVSFFLQISFVILPPLSSLALKTKIVALPQDPADCSFPCTQTVPPPQ